MSRVGNNPIKIEEGTEVNITGKVVSVKGPLGTLTVDLPGVLDAKVEDGNVIVSSKSDDKKSKSLHGTFRSLVANAVVGVKDGYVKNLELVGVGYRARMEGSKLIMSLGLNHTIDFETPEGLKMESPDETKIVISGIDKQQVGEFAAKIREVRKPEPYKGKGIRYQGEHVRKKSAKSSVTSK